MSVFVRCPDCNRQLKIPETAMGKTIRCPACKTLIPSASQPRSTATDPNSAESDSPSLHAVQTPPPPQTAPALSRSHSLQDEETEDEATPGMEKPVRKKSAVGLIIGLVGGGGALLLMLLGTGVGLLWYFVLNRTIPDAEWQTYSPPGGDCTVLMPGMPVPQPMTINGVALNKYLVDRKKEQALFAVAFLDLGANLLQPNILDRMVNAERDLMVRQLQGTVTSESSK